MTDRELDALVAEKVMGWHKGAELSSAWFDSRHNFVHWKEWCPTVDIKAAWEVVEKMREEGTDVDIYWSGNEWIVTLGENPGGSPDGATSDTAPRAICLAALRAKGVEV